MWTLVKMLRPTLLSKKGILASDTLIAYSVEGRVGLQGPTRRDVLADSHSLCLHSPLTLLTLHSCLSGTCAAISGPRIAGENLYGPEALSEDGRN